MAKLQQGYPENWSEMTPEEKRNWRLDRFVRGEGVKFVSPEARQAYQIRAQRYVDVYNVREPDRVPVNLPVADLPYVLHGINYHTSMYQVEKAI